MNKTEAIKFCLDNKIPDLKIKLQKLGICYEKFISVLGQQSYNLKQDLNINSSKATRLTKSLFPDKPKNTKICIWLLFIYGYKYCTACKETKLLSQFDNNKSSYWGKADHCKICFYKETKPFAAAKTVKRQCDIDLRIPKWSNIQEIEEFYSRCPVGHHVDHIIPLKGKIVSGLHVINNLQYLSAQSNLEKSNKFIW